MLHDHLRRLLTWQDAHVGFDDAVAAFPAALRGVRPEKLPYSAWALVEHLRFTQRDLLDFCTRPDYTAPAWPDAYWPDDAAPPSDDAWDAAVDAFRADRRALVALLDDEAFDLFARIPHGDGQTYLRSLLLAADHNAYHVGQLVLVRRLLGVWPPEETA